MAQEMCSIHPDKEVVDVCVHCGKRVCVACAATLAGKTYCLECIKLVDATAAGQVKEVPWEKKGELGFFRALIDTWTGILLRPKRFFQNMPTKAGIGNPLLFGMICGCTVVIVTALINIIAVASGAAVPNLPAGAPAEQRAAAIASYVVLIVISPLLVAGGIFLLSAVYHLAVLVFGGKEGFRATFRILSYTNALSIFNIIPVLGPIFVTVYSVILFVLGFKESQKMNTPKAVMAALLPMLLLFVVGFAAAFYLASRGLLPPVAGLGGRQ
jgi:hypothetical protein